MTAETIPAKAWFKVLAPYREPHAGRSVFEIAVTVAPLLALWVAAWLLYSHGFWWAALLLTVPSAAFLVRLFLIQHDCGHGAFFKSRVANEWVGRAAGILTITPFHYWRQAHALHHATSGNLDRRSGLGEIETLTVEEYRALPPLRRLGYRLYRHPLVMFGIGPAYVFILSQRVPIGMMRQGWRPWASVMGNSFAALVGLCALVWMFGLWPVLTVNLVTMLIAGSAGVWLFYVQHQFEGATWTRDGVWNRDEAALAGSSHLHLPQPLRWMTANIGVHHVHHLSSRIPFYHLPTVLNDHPELAAMGRLGIRDALRCTRLALWDEVGGRMVSFRDAQRAA